MLETVNAREFTTSEQWGPFVYTPRAPGMTVRRGGAVHARARYEYNRVCLLDPRYIVYTYIFMDIHITIYIRKSRARQRKRSPRERARVLL